MPNLGSRLAGVPIDTRGGVEAHHLVVRSGVLVSEPMSLMERVYYTADDTWTKADYTDIRAVFIRVVGAGGGGGGCEGTSATQACAGGGGGGGAYAEALILAAALGTTETVQVGVGGAGGAAGDNVGVTGQASFFGSHCVANGGAGGSGDPATAVPRYGATGGAGGTGGTGDLLMDGGRGLPMIILEEVVSPSPGGGTMFAPMRTSSLTASGTAGSDGVLYGGGASGGANADDQGSGRAGGDGADGLVIVDILY